ncbi:hypothetical protein BR93DRAFT_922189 [Coniochaeta sp. PMI_546]|nr:hypothetical protein BR93DRAFT_922189 [Coniochaeta sp. PMI_546]
MRSLDLQAPHLPNPVLTRLVGRSGSRWHLPCLFGDVKTSTLLAHDDASFRTEHIDRLSVGRVNSRQPRVRYLAPRCGTSQARNWAQRYLRFRASFVVIVHQSASRVSPPLLHDDMGCPDTPVIVNTALDLIPDDVVGLIVIAVAPLVFLNFSDPAIGQLAFQICGTSRARRG